MTHTVVTKSCFEITDFEIQPKFSVFRWRSISENKDELFYDFVCSLDMNFNQNQLEISKAIGMSAIFSFDCIRTSYVIDKIQVLNWRQYASIGRCDRSMYVNRNYRPNNLLLFLKNKACIYADRIVLRGQIDAPLKITTHIQKSLCEHWNFVYGIIVFGIFLKLMIPKT